MATADSGSNGASIAEQPQSGNDSNSGNASGSGDGVDLIMSESLPGGISERSNAGLLTLKDIEFRLETDYSRLVRLANAPGIGEMLGAVHVPGAKGVRYEPRALDVFRRLLAASDAGELTPKTAAAWLKSNAPRAIAEKPQSDNSLTRPDNSLTHGDSSSTELRSSEGMNRGLAMILGPVVSIMQEVRDLLRGRNALDAPATAPLPDRLLTPEEAAGLLACKPRSVGRHVPPVSESPRRYRESDVLHYIAGMTPIQRQENSK